MRMFAIAALVLAATVAGAQERTPSPPGAEVYIISPKDGAKVSGPVVVRFGLKGMGIAPAGVKFENTGHHHLLIDTDAPTDMSQPLPASDKVVHFGKGQTETSLTLPPGKHTLQLLLGDQNHVPHNPPVISKKITIIVTK
ncbi:MAG: Rod shape-determining protein RodA [Gammaproteobacteria bacterium]|nr:Rod shape-determining protein RodA [Gammaproteobacteria bacterium]